MVPYRTEMIRRRKDRAGALEFGRFIRGLRRARGRTVRALARATHIPHATWSRGERGLLDLRKWDYIISLAKALGVPEEDLAKRAVLGRPRPMSLVKQAGMPGPAVVRITAEADTLLRLAPALPEFRDALTALVLKSSKTGDLTPLREVAAYAKGLLARSSGGRKTRKPAPLRDEHG